MDHSLIFAMGFAIVLIFLGLWVTASPCIKNLRNKHVFITGGSYGIGFEIAKEALLQQAFVTIVARSPDKLRQAASDLIQATNCSADRVRYEIADISDYRLISEAVRNAHLWKPIDMLICNAGVGKTGYLDEITLEDMNTVVQTNVNGTLYTLHAALPLMKPAATKCQPKSIVVVASLAALNNLYGEAAYTATKYAQKGLAEAMRLELLPHNITVTLSCPGFTDTSFLHQLLEGVRNNKDKEIMDAMRIFNMYHEKSVESPEAVAKYTLEGAKNGRFLVGPKVPGLLAASVSRGFFPADSFLQAFAELLLSVPFRLWSFFVAAFTPSLLKMITAASHHVQT